MSGVETKWTWKEKEIYRLYIPKIKYYMAVYISCIYKLYIQPYIYILYIYIYISCISCIYLVYTRYIYLYFIVYIEIQWSN